MRKILSAIIALLIFQQAVAQQDSDPVLLTVAGEKITRSEFMRVYNKNNTKEDKYNQEAIREYLELYINYKLKVKEAEETRLDTIASFATELAGYRKQLAQPYLTDKEVTEQLIREAYERMKQDVHASHILVKVAPDALPSDTIEAWERISLVRQYVTGKGISASQLAAYERKLNSAIKDPESRAGRLASVKALMNKPKSSGNRFAEAARAVSEDPSVKDNGGDLGYFTSLMMVYPFETAAYSTKPGEVSMPVRTKYGYHLVRVNDVRQAVGEIHAAHIMIKCGPEASDSVERAARKRIDEIYAKVKAGENFEELAIQHSDDKGSAKSGGVLPWFGTGRMVPAFEKAAFALGKDNDLSKPVRTSYGWHIIKRLERRGIASFEEKKTDLKNRIARDSRSETSKTSMIARIKKESHFKEYLDSKESLIAALDTNLANGQWKASAVENMKKQLFRLGDKTYTQTDFAGYMESRQSRRSGTSPQAIGYQMYENYVNETCLAYEESLLDEKYPEFKSLMQEYRDGILLFDLTDKKVWSKAVKDTAGLEAYYEKNKEKYKWDKRLDAVIYTCADEKVASRVRKLLKKGKPLADIREEVNKSSQLNLTVREDLFLEGDHEVVDSIAWEKGLGPDISHNGQIVFVKVREVLPPTVKKLDEARGLVTADYQNQLEKEWIGQLRNKYTVKVDEQVLGTIGKDK